MTSSTSVLAKCSLSSSQQLVSCCLCKYCKGLSSALCFRTSKNLELLLQSSPGPCRHQCTDWPALPTKLQSCIPGQLVAAHLDASPAMRGKGQIWCKSSMPACRPSVAAPGNGLLVRESLASVKPDALSSPNV